MGVRHVRGRFVFMNTSGSQSKYQRKFHHASVSRKGKGTFFFFFHNMPGHPVLKGCAQGKLVIWSLACWGVS